MRYVRPEATPDGCLLWGGRVGACGYGRCSPSRFGTTSAHRAAYQIFKGPIPDGLTVHHKCFNTACVNPAHLTLLTASENAKIRKNPPVTHCPRGHAYDVFYRRQDGRTRKVCSRCESDRLAAHRLRKATEWGSVAACL